jgi:hypothetical protein
MEQVIKLAESFRPDLPEAARNDKLSFDLRKINWR